jgi:PAS domain S-box-containing protein
VTTPADASGAGAGPEALRDPVRLSAVEATGLVDGPGVVGLDRLTTLAAKILGAPVATATLVTDTEQFWASAHGVPEPWNSRRRTPLSHSFCQHVVTSDTPLILDDAREDERVCDNLAVPELGVIAYAGFPLRDPEGQVLGSFCVIDTEVRHWTPEQMSVLETLTEAAASEIALRLSNQNLQRAAAHLDDVLASAHDAFVSIGADGLVREWNLASERLFGWSKKEAIGAVLADLVVPERFRFAHEQGLARVRDGALISRRQEVTACNRAGIEFPVQMTLHVAQHHGGPVIHAFIYSVTEQQDREISLQRERTFLAGVVDSVDVGVAACGSDGSMALFNKAMRRVWGTASEPENAQSWGSAVGLYEPDGVTRLPAEQAPLARALAGEPVRDVEMVLDAPGIGQRRFLANAQPVVTAEGRGLGAVVALHDITDRRRSEMIRAAQDVASRTFAESTTLEDGVQRVIGDVCEVMGWAGGEYWQVDAEREVLTRMTAWWSPGLDPELAEVEAGARQVLARGEGVSGLVWSTGKPFWVPDLDEHPDRYSRLVPFAAVGLRSAIGIFNQSDSQPGVLTFLAARMDEPDRELLIALEAITAHIGRFLERRRSRDLMLSLARARQDFNRVIETVNDHVWTIRLEPDGQARRVFASANQEAVYGGRLESDTGSKLTELVHPDDRPLLADYLRVARSGEPAELTCRLVGLDGVTRWVWTRAALRHDGDVVYLDGISTNVTARKEQEIQLSEERRRLRQAQAIARIGSWEWDAEHIELAWTDTLFEIYGVEPGSITPFEAHMAAIHPADQPRMGPVMIRLRETGEPFQQRYRIIRPDGQMRWLEARGEALYDSEHRLERHAGTAMDVTEQVEAQRAIVSREAMLRAVLANSQSLIYVKDLQGRYLMANETLLQARGMTEEELLGQDDFALDPALAPVWQENDRRALVEGEYAVEEWFEAPEGRCYYDTVKFPLYDGEGQVYAVCGISLDVTTRKRAAEAMTEARDAALAAAEA